MKTDLPPDEEVLVKMLSTAFDRLPEPDVTRLTALEQRLDRHLRTSQNQRKHPALYWWMLGGLIATGAAAWWVGDYFRTGAPVVPAPQQNSAPAAGSPEDSLRGRPQQEPAPERQPGEQRQGAEQKEAPVIYRRERY
jgi:hypothetical protein